MIIEIMVLIAGNAPPQISPSNIQKVQKELDDNWNKTTEENTRTKRVLPKYYKGYFKTKNAFNKFNNLFNKDDNANKVEEMIDYLKSGKIPDKYVNNTDDTNSIAKLNKFKSYADFFI